MPEWAYAIIGAAFLGLIGVVWRMLNDKMKEHKEHCDHEIEMLWNQIGRDSNSGMRNKLHNSVPMGAHIELEKRVTDLEDER